MSSSNIRFLCFAVVLSFFLSCLNGFTAESFKINDDGKKLIQEARQAYDSDMRDRAVLTDKRVTDYVRTVLEKLKRTGKSLPKGVNLHIVVIDSPIPEVSTYMDGHMMISSGMVFSLDNEAQLASVLAPQLAYLTEGYYLALYQQIKARERKGKYKAVTGAMFGALLDTAVDYAVDVHTMELTEDIWSGDATYRETMRQVIAIEAGQSAYYGLKDVITSVPVKDNQGKAIDPRLQFEPIADAQGLIFLTMAGYDPSESSKGSDNILRINQKRLKDEEQAMGAFAGQLRAQRSMMEAYMLRMKQYMGDSGLIQTPVNMPPSRSQYLGSLLDMKEVKEAMGGHSGTKGEKEYRIFLENVLLSRAQTALSEERYDEAHNDYKLLYDRGIRSAPVAYGLAKSQLGDFAFGASRAELKAAEKAYREAISLDPGFAEPYKGLAEMYSDTEEYEDAVKAWETYLKLVPDTSDRKKIERKIKTLKKKASR